jgi:hypothetical protein
MECGASLRGIADDTGEVPVIRSNDTASTGVQDEVSQALGRLAGSAGTSDEPGQRPTAPPYTPPRGGAAPSSPPADETLGDPLLQRSRAAGTTTGPSTEERFYGQPAPWQHDPHATVRLPVQPPREPSTGELPRTGEHTPAYGRAVDDGTATDEHTEPYDEYEPWPDEWTEGAVAEPRRFRFRTLFVMAVLTAAATVVGVLSLLIEIRVPAGASAPFGTGTWMVNDFGTNNTVAALLAAAAVVTGAFLWCFGFRWGAGLAGGGGLAVAGWATLLIGLAEWPIFEAEQVGTPAPTVTRELGYWALWVAAGLGVVVFVTSLNGSGRDRQGGLDPWIAALGAASFLVAAGGPLIPMGTADFSGNYSSETLGVELPDMFFIGRLVQLGLLAFSGIVGFLLVRRYGLGLAIGGGLAAGFMLVTAATDQTATPIGPAFANPGALDLAPHGVTIVGMALAGFFALVAVVMALLDSGR